MQKTGMGQGATSPARFWLANVLYMIASLLLFEGSILTAATVQTPAADGVSLSSLSVNPATVPSGGSATVTLNLSGPAPAGGASVSVYSQTPSAFPVPSSYSIAAGQTSGSFNVQAGTVSATTALNIAAGYGGSSKYAAVTVTGSSDAVTLSSIGISPTTVTAGGSATVTLRLSGPAPTGGAAVSVASRETYAFPAPNTYMIPAGQTSGSFSVQTGAVSTSTTVTVQAGYGGPVQSAIVTVNPVPVVTLSGLTVSPSTVTAGGTATVTLTLSGPAPASGASVSFASRDTYAFPSLTTYLIPAGQVSASFTVRAGPVSTPATVTVQAGFGGPALSTTVTVVPAPPSAALSSINVSPATVTSGGTVTTTLTLSGPAPDGGASVSVYSQTPAVFPSPSSFLIPAGQSSGSFSVQAGAVTTTTVVNLGAGYGGASKYATVTVTPGTPTVTLSSIGISPSTVSAGGTATVTLTLSGPAPTGGATVSVSSGNVAAFPAQSSYLIETGHSSGSFSVVAGSVTAATPVTVGGGYGGASRSATVTVTPVATSVALSSINVSPATVTSGGTATVILTLSGKAPDGGASVSVYSQTSAVFPTPSSFLIPAGQSSGSFRVQAGTVTATTVVNLGAGYGGAGKYATVTVTPGTPTIGLSSIGISPSTVTAGGTATVTLTLSGPAPDGGASVSVASQTPSAFPVPSTYLIPAGQSSGSFSV
jgi:trimeric autotransporter adhesin